MLSLTLQLMVYGVIALRELILMSEFSIPMLCPTPCPHHSAATEDIKMTIKDKRI